MGRVTTGMPWLPTVVAVPNPASSKTAAPRVRERVHRCVHSGRPRRVTIIALTMQPRLAVQVGLVVGGQSHGIEVRRGPGRLDKRGDLQAAHRALGCNLQQGSQPSRLVELRSRYLTHRDPCSETHQMLGAWRAITHRLLMSQSPKSPSPTWPTVQALSLYSHIHT